MGCRKSRPKEHDYHLDCVCVGIGECAGLTRASIIFAKFMRRGWTRGSSPRATAVDGRAPAQIDGFNPATCLYGSLPESRKAKTRLAGREHVEIRGCRLTA